MSTSIIVKCPSGLTVRLHGLRIRDLDVFAEANGKSTTKILDAQDQIFRSCVEEVVDPGPAGPAFMREGGKVEWTKALMTDRFAVLLGLRRVTKMLGSSYSFPHVCPACGNKQAVDVDLAELPVYAMGEGCAEKIGRGENRFDAELDDGMAFSFRALTGDDQRKLAKLIKNNERQQVTAGLTYRLLALDGITAPADIKRKLEQLDGDVLEQFGNAFDAVEGGTDTLIEFECDSCGDECKVSIPFDLGRFFSREKKAETKPEKKPRRTVSSSDH